MFQPLVNIPADIFNSVALTRPSFSIYAPGPNNITVRAGMRNMLFICDQKSGKNIRRILSNQIYSIYGVPHTPDSHRGIIARIHTADAACWGKALDSKSVEVCALNKHSLGLSQGFMAMPSQDGSHAAQTHIIVDCFDKDISEFKKYKRFSYNNILSEIQTLTEDRIGCTMIISEDEVTQEIIDMFDIAWTCQYTPRHPEESFITAELTKTIYKGEGLKLTMPIFAPENHRPYWTYPDLRNDPRGTVNRVLKESKDYIRLSQEADPFSDILEILETLKNDLLEMKQFNDRNGIRTRTPGRLIKKVMSVYSAYNLKGMSLL